MSNRIPSESTSVGFHNEGGRVWKRVSFWLAVGLVATQWTGLVLAGGPLDAQTLSIRLRFDPPKLAQKDAVVNVSVADCETLHRIGQPMLPFRVVRMLLPPDVDPSTLVLRTDMTGLADWSVPGLINYERAPVRYPGANESVRDESNIGEPDASIYHSDASFPRLRAELASVQNLAGHPIAFVRVYPVQYLPMQNKITSATEIVLSLVTSRGRLPLKSPQKSRPERKGRIAALVDNPSLLNTYETSDLQQQEASADYLLITKGELVPAFAPLVNHKTDCGLSVRVETVENISTNYTGRDLAEKVRNCIRFAQTNWGVVYVLLGGDISIIPCRYGYVYMGALVSDYQVPTDLYYGCLDGSWDANQNSRFGEPNDGPEGGDVDLLAEVYVGRAPVETAAEAGTFVEKTIRYQSQQHEGRTNALFMAEYLGNYPSGPAQGGDMFDPSVPLFGAYGITWLDDRPSTSPQWTGSDAIERMNNSPQLALFNGHGDYDRMMRLTTPQLDSLTNAWPFLIYSVGCNAGQFDNDKWTPDAIGEELVKRHSRGAFAAILNSRRGWFDPANEWRWSGEFQARFFERLLGGGQTNLGAACQLGREDMLAHVETGGIMTYRWCYYEMTLFGDPHVRWQSVQTEPVFRLAVASPFDQASPPVGTNDWIAGAAITCLITNPIVPGGGGIQYVCTGWSGTGSVPADGSELQTSFVITNDSLIAWTWKTQFCLTAVAANGGTILATNWHDSGSRTVVQAWPSKYWHFVNWTGDIPSEVASNNTASLIMDRPRTLTARFSENLAYQNTPEWWLASYGWTNEFDTAAAADWDGDGMAAWQEYVAGTSPVDFSSALRLALRPVATLGWEISWSSCSNRIYSLLQSTDLLSGSFLPISDAIPSTPPTNTYFIESTVGSGFFKIAVRHAEE